jgi:hypothetical protein
MNTLLRLPLILLEMALRQGAGAVKDILRRVSGGAGDDGGGGERPFSAPVDPRGARREAEVVAASEARARRPEARPRATPRRRPAAAPAPAAPPEPAPAHVSREAETVASFGPADDPSAALEVQAPWREYDSQPAAEVLKRVRAADEATRAVVLLYERAHKARSSVIKAASGQPATA